MGNNQLASNILTSTRNFIPLFILGILIASCTVRLIAPYDEVTDKRVSELQENILLTFRNGT